MNKGTEQPSTRDSDNATDMPRHEVDVRKEDKERSHGKRRTAREIANMFEQLKQRHILRKKEWAEEKETLMKRLQMAEESKNVLSELKEILENLREELRLEEKKRLQMELNHLKERTNWESERAVLLNKIEESAHESDKDGKGLQKLSEKMLEQANQINELQETQIELKRRILESDRRYMRDTKDLQHQLDAERTTWKKMEQDLLKKIRQLSNGKSSTSSLSPSPEDVQNPTRDFIETEDATGWDQSIDQSWRRTDDNASSHSNFERKVNDALKQIEKIRYDFCEYRNESDSLQTKSSDFKTSASPSPLLDNVTQTSTSKVPWRTKTQTTISEQYCGRDGELRPTKGGAQGTSSADATISLQSISNVQKLTPIPDRKFKKLNGQYPKRRISEFASSPDALGQYIYSDEIDVGKTTEETSVTQSGIESSLDIKDQSLIDSLDDSNQLKDNVRSGKSNVKSSSGRASNADAATSEKLGARSTSPRLPKLHQQLLFKRDPTPSHYAQENKNTSEIVRGKDFKYSDKILQSQPFKDHISTHTPYFAPSTGYAKGGKQRMTNAGDLRPNRSITDKSTSSKYDEKQTIISLKHQTGSVTEDAGLRKDESERVDSYHAATKLERGHSIGIVTQAPAVHPKPKVSIHKDQDGNIIHVSPANGKRSKRVENAAPEKQYSIAERMGKAGRDWIRKKLHFKDKLFDDNEDMQQGASHKKKGKQKHRRESSLLKSKRESTSVTSSEESSDGELKKRESLMRRNRRKGKSNASTSPTKPKKYTRSQTDGSPKEMKKFLSKFKHSQSSFKKPSVVRKFERQLIENDIRTLKEEDGVIDFNSNIGTPMPARHNTFDRKVENCGRTKDNKTLYGQVKTSHRLADDRNGSQLVTNTIHECSNDPNISETAKLGSEWEDNASNHMARRGSQNSYLDDLKPGEDDNKERLTVSRLVNRFSTHFDDANEARRVSPLRSSIRKTGDGTISRSRSLTIHDAIPNEVDFTKGTSRESDQVKYDSFRNDGFTWHDKVIAPTESDDNDVSKEETTHITESSRKKFQSLSNFWEDKHSNGHETKEIEKPRKAKLMSDEMKQKTSMLETVLLKAPKKARKYRRADTQPVAWNHDSEDDESSIVSEELDVTYELISTRQNMEGMQEEFCDEVAENMHDTIPHVTGKFNKPAKPGRLPSRWAK